MSLFSKLYQAVRSWRQRGASKTNRSSNVTMERLDHRQLLSVNFTGNVATDFPASMQPGVVVLPDNANVQHPTTSYPGLAALVPVSGFDISGIRVSYSPSSDTLSIGLEQPPSGQPGQPGPVIAGDADDNGNDGTVNPAVTALTGGAFQDLPNFGGSEYMAAFLDLTGSGTPNVVAGFAGNDQRSTKQYQVAQANVNAISNFGTELPQYEGSVFKVNSPAAPNLEFSIAHFSELYLQETGKVLTPSTTIDIGAVAGSGQDLFTEAYFPEAAVNIGAASPPTTPVTPVTPASPPIVINYHENRHINTAHDTLVRAYVLGSSGFNVANIIPSTVTLGGAHPISVIDRFVNNDEWPDATFVFRGTDINLPAGYTEATLSGTLTNGSTFSSMVRVFNRNPSFYTPQQELGVHQRETARATYQNGFTVLPTGSPLTPSSGTSAATNGVASATYQNGFTVLPTGSPLTSATSSSSTPTIATISAAALTPQPPATSPSPVASQVSIASFTPQATIPTVSVPGHVSAARSVTLPTSSTVPRLSGKLERSVHRFARHSTQVTASAPSKPSNPATSQRARLPRKLHSSLNHFVRTVGVSNFTPPTPVAGGA